MTTRQHIKNLFNHADFVEKQPKINMETFALDKHNHDITPKEVHTCGSAMCAIGYIPLNPDINLDIDLEGAWAWHKVSEEAFGIADGTDWNFTFGADVPNDPKIVADGMRTLARRLEYRLDNPE